MIDARERRSGGQKLCKHMRSLALLLALSRGARRRTSRNPREKERRSSATLSSSSDPAAALSTTEIKALDSALVPPRFRLIGVLI